MTDFDPREVDEILDEAYPKPSEKIAPGTEAPASVTVHAWNQDNFGVMFTMRDIDMKNLYARTSNFLKVLKSEGWKPDWKTEGSTTLPPTQKAVVSQSSVPSATPNCGVHGTPMTWKTGVSKKTGRPYAFWSCGEMNNGMYCDYKVK